VTNDLHFTLIQPRLWLKVGCYVRPLHMNVVCWVFWNRSTLCSCWENNSVIISYNYM
jgi:hypothetical protein